MFLVGLVVGLFVLGLVQYHLGHPVGTVIVALSILTWALWPSKKGTTP